ncbi:MAG: cation transporter [Planctomycetes bacterium]|nr:cation transporter [Planctomycetota bacterium]
MSAAAPDAKGVIKALIAGIAANLAIAICKFLAFLFTGSAAMLAESLHSFADTSNQGLLALGLKRGAIPPNEKHPFGHQKERYFWAFIVSLMIFLLGGAFAIYEGVHKLGSEEKLANVGWSYGALAFALVVEGFALRVAYREFQELRREQPGPLLQVLRETKDPTLPTVMFEDAAAVVGLLVALLGVTLTVITGDAIWDALASIVIGVVLVGVAFFLAVESHSLLVGEAASAQDQATIRRLAELDPAVERIVELLTLQLGPQSILIALTLDFRDDMRTEGIENSVLRLEESIRRDLPSARYIFVEAGSFRPPAQA